MVCLNKVHLPRRVIRRMETRFVTGIKWEKLNLGGARKLGLLNHVHIRRLSLLGPQVQQNHGNVVTIMDQVALLCMHVHFIRA